MSSSNPDSAKVAILLCNLGTPDEATTPAIRQFLKVFLSDQRVVELSPWLWQIILRCIVLPFRPKKILPKYQKIWDQDSPMRKILNQQVTATQKHFGNEAQVLAAMSYGSPNIHQQLDQIAASNQIEHLILLPLFPQYSATSSAVLYDAVAKWCLKQRNLPHISIIKDYYQHPLFVQALAQSVSQFQQTHGQPDRLLMSFHGIPQINADKGDPYAERCIDCAHRLAAHLNLKPEQWHYSFQSRFGRQQWLKPYTSELLEQWTAEGVKHVQVISPAFSADCLETLEELAIENRDVFLGAGGSEYHYIPALNTENLHLELICDIIQQQISAFSAIR